MSSPSRCLIMTTTIVGSPNDDRSFTPFPQLPVEIRLKIWEAYINLHPRVVEVGTRDDEDTNEGENDCENSKAGEANDDDSKERKSSDGEVDSSKSETGGKSITFYSPTPLPEVLSINHEARTLALESYISSFANGSQSAYIIWNPAIDTIFLPAWCFEYNVENFMAGTSAHEKALIQKLAFETLVRYGSEDGMINLYIHIDEFRNLKEILLVQREPDSTGCGCCHDFDGPEDGVASFRDCDEWAEVGADVEQEEAERGDSEIKNLGWSDITESASERIAAVEGEEETEAEAPMRRPTMVEEAMEVLFEIHEQDPAYSVPVVREVDLLRDGIRI
jgi:hypothetical protein